MKRIVGWLVMMCLMCLAVACSDPDHGPKLGPFAAITKTQDDKPFDIVAPSSRSPAAFTFTSSDLNVATIAGTLVTIKGPGVTTITATQPSIGSYGPTSASTTLTVTAVACAANSVRVNNVCTPKPTCIAPAVLTDNTCVAPVTGAGVVTTDRLWMGISNNNVNIWDNASNFCANSIIASVGDWRLPTADELLALYRSGAIAGHNWTLDNTWSSTPATNGDTAGHIVVNLNTGAMENRANTFSHYVTCVRQL